MTSVNDRTETSKQSQESKVGQAMLTDYEALFEGSIGKGLISINGNYYNTIYGENLNLGNSLPEF